jgi:hypothetical protein
MKNYISETSVTNLQARTHTQTLAFQNYSQVVCFYLGGGGGSEWITFLLQKSATRIQFMSRVIYFRVSVFL